MVIIAVVGADWCGWVASPARVPGARRLLPAVAAGCLRRPRPRPRRRPPTEEAVFDALLARYREREREGMTPQAGGRVHRGPHRRQPPARRLRAPLPVPVPARSRRLAGELANITNRIYGHVDAGQVYGVTEASRRLLRARSGGRLLSRQVDGEEFPACVEDAPVPMVRPGPGRRLPFYFLTGAGAGAGTAEPCWALGHPMLSSTPLVFAVAVLWLREHNRVAALLADEHPHWDGDQLYDTARRVVTAEMVLVLLRELVPAVWGGGGAGGGVATATAALGAAAAPDRPPPPPPAELPLALFWGWQLPDVLEVGGEAFNMTDLMFTNQRLVVERGLGAVLTAAAEQPAGKACAHNSGALVRGWTKRVLLEGRRARLQPLARYRALLGLPAHRDLQDLAGGDARTAEALRGLYGHVDAVELLPGAPVTRSPSSRFRHPLSVNLSPSPAPRHPLPVILAPSHPLAVTFSPSPPPRHPLSPALLVPGLLAERAAPGAMLPSTLRALTLPWILAAALSSPLGAPWTWTPDQFGGQVGSGWVVVEAASLRALVCKNVRFPDGKPCSPSWTVPRAPPAPPPSSSSSSALPVCAGSLDRVSSSATLSCSLPAAARVVLEAAVV
ncbi:Prostaglandin G/H synthase 1 [Frankliniella fusca]|uniref:Prostaglandin G/H synthase 1 n=1 Tax=Frankliniella fusca TaxID=407009 RepID=A0AAE1LQB1_9NEOP|nr:Prostaglandin G/H synthase 1 [Frankliniella fusca]